MLVYLIYHLHPAFMLRLRAAQTLVKSNERNVSTDFGLSVVEINVEHFLCTKKQYIYFQCGSFNITFLWAAWSSN